MFKNAISKLSTLVVLVFVLAFLPTSVHSQIIKFDHQLSQYDLTAQIEYNISENDINDPPPIEGWSQFTKSELTFGFDKRIHWFRFELKNISPYHISTVLNLNNPLLDNLVVYTLIDGKVRTVQHLGDEQPFFERPLVEETFAIPISFAAGEHLEFYIAMQSEGFIKSTLQLWDSNAFHQFKSAQKLLHGAGLGIALLAFLLAMYQFRIEKQPASLYNALFILSFSLIIITITGYGFHYLWPNFPALQQHGLYFFTLLTAIASAQYASEMSKHFFSHFIQVKIYRIISITGLAALPLTLAVPHSIAIYLCFAIATVVATCHLAVGIQAWREGITEHQELTFSSGIIVIGALLVILDSMAVTFMPLSLPLQLLITLALTVFVMIAAQIRYANTNPLMQSGNNDDINAVLSDRMLELQLALREVEEKNQILEQLNTLDALSGIHNRRHFDKRLTAEYRRASRELSTLALILLDIDHFKKVNDHYGHLAGDEIIRTVALLISEQLNRPGDDAFRYGGEEFAVILPSTDEQGALLVAEQIRSAIESHVFVYKDETIRCTISLGIATYHQHNNVIVTDLVEQADKALYLAKQNGRNQTKTFSLSNME